MNCREFTSLVRAGGAGSLGEAARAHRAACAACDREARAAALLRLGSALASEHPREGFEARLRARIEAESTSPSVLTWADGIGLLARPALGVASVALAAALAWSGWTYSRPTDTDDFAVLTGGDPLYDTVLAGGLDEMASAEPAATQGAGEAP